jgi:uncharacterized membrane protein YgcG
MPFAAAVLALLLAQSLPPAPLHHVTDAANVLDDARKQALEEKLARFERETRTQILVYVDRTVPAGVALEAMTADAMRTWPRQDDCAILFIYVDSRQTRLQTSDSVRRVIPDDRAKQIITDLRPLLRAGEFTGAVEQAANVMTGILAPAAPAESASPMPPQPQPSQQPIVYLPDDEPPPRRIWPMVGKVLSIFGVAAVIIVIVIAAAASHAGQRRSGSPHPHQQQHWQVTQNPTFFTGHVDSSPPPDSSSGGSSSDSSGSSGGGGASDSW